MVAEKDQRTANIYLSLLILALVIIVQGTLLARLRFFGASPNLLLVVVVGWSLLRSVSEGLLWSFAGGLGVDLIAGLPLGTTALALMPTCFLAGLGRSRVFASSLPLPVLLAALATPIAGWINLLTQQLRGVAVDWIGSTLRVILPELALNVLLVVVMYPILRWFALRLGAARLEW
jgi:rod shape-determining protein MreD